MIWAFKNLAAGAVRWPLWTRLAVADIQQTYRRSFIGMAWITFSFAMFIGVKILIFGSISAADNDLFAAWLSIGFLIWAYVAGNVTDGCNVFINARPWILGTKMPLSVFVYQSLTRHLINLAYSSLVIIVLLWVLKWQLTSVAWWAIPGMLVLVLNAWWVQIFLGVLSSRHRDLIHLVQSGMRVLFFITPILYMPDQLGGNAFLLTYNPFTHFLAIVRDPIVLGTIPSASWMVALGFSVFGWILAILTLQFWGRRVPFWV
ncbi:MAG: hypothetical protein COA47_13280 [Robiginitomaculum sp.]|nr:MAG: hypothetical protein COA47_13280 [Robiginitomaculum sp.]